MAIGYSVWWDEDWLGCDEGESGVESVLAWGGVGWG